MHLDAPEVKWGPERKIIEELMREEVGANVLSLKC